MIMGESISARCACGKTYSSAGSAGKHGVGPTEYHDLHHCSRFTMSYPLVDALYRLGLWIASLAARFPRREKPKLLMDVRACAHCKRPPREHGDDGKCLFDATNYLALTDEQLNAFYTKASYDFETTYLNKAVPVKQDAVAKATEEILAAMQMAAPEKKESP